MNQGENPLYVERGLRKIFPSSFNMAFKRIKDDADNCAVNISENKVDGIKWTRTEAGKYELKSDKQELPRDVA